MYFTLTKKEFYVHKKTIEKYPLYIQMGARQVQKRL